MGASDVAGEFAEELFEHVIEPVIDIALEKLAEEYLDPYINPDIPPTVVLHHVALGYWNRWVDYTDAYFLLEGAASFHTNEQTAYTGQGKYNIVHAHINNDPGDPNNLANLDNLRRLFSPTEHNLQAIVVNSTASLPFHDIVSFARYWGLLGDVGALYPDGRPLVLEFVPATVAQLVAAIDTLVYTLDRTKLGIAIKLPAGEAVPVTFDQLRAWPELFSGLPAGPTIELSATGFDLVNHAELIDGFAATRIDRIIITDPGFASVTFSVAQYTAAARWIALAELADGTPLKVVIRDNNEILSEALVSDTLNEDLISRIEVGGPLLVDVEHARGDLTGAWALIDDPDYHIEIRDGAAEVSQYLAQGQLPIEINRIEHIVVTDDGAVSLPVAAFLAQSETGLLEVLLRHLEGVSQRINVDVRDTADSIQSQLNALSSSIQGIDRIITSDGQDLWLDPVSLLDEPIRNLIEKLYDETTDSQAQFDIRADGQTIWNMRNELLAFVELGWIDEIIITSGGLPTLSSLFELTEILPILGKLELLDGTPARVSLQAPYLDVRESLDFLQDHVAHLASVGISDATGEPLIFSSSQVVRNAGLLAVLDGNVPLRVTGTAAEINAQHAPVFALGDRIEQIWILDGAPVDLSVAEAAAGFINKLTNEGVSPGTANIYGTRADILHHLDLFKSNVDHVNAIFMTEPAPMSLPASVVQAHAEVLSLIQPDGLVTRIFVVVGSAAEIAFSLDALQDIESQIGNVHVNDAALITLSVGQLERNGEVLARVSRLDLDQREIVIEDDIANILSSLDALSSFVASNPHSMARIDATGAVDGLVLPASDVVRYSSILTLLHDASNGLLLTFGVQGSAAEALASLDSLQGLADQITRVDLTDDAGHPSISATQLLRDLPVILKIFNPDGTVLKPAIADAAGAVGFYFDQLAAISGSFHGPITITDSQPVPLTVAQIAAFGELLERLADADGTDYALAVVDSAANILAGLQGVLANGHVTSVSVVDSFANIVAAQDALAGSGAQINSIGIVDTVANALAGWQLLSGQAPVSSIRIVDTAANVAAGLEDLRALAGVIDGVFITDPQTAIRLSTEQLSTDRSVLDLIENTYTIELAGNLADVRAGLEDLPARAQLSRLIVVDTAEVIAASHDDIYVHGLTTEANFSPIVIVSDNQPVVLDSAADAVTLAHVAGVFFFNADGSQPQVSFSDTAAAIAIEAHELIGRVPSAIASISITDGAPLLLHLSWLPQQATHDFLAKLSHADGSSVVPHFYENAQNLNEGGLALISANLSRPGLFVINDNAPLTLPAGLAAASADALARLLQIDGGPARIQVTDTASAISANFDALAALPGIVGILAADAPVTLTAAQIASDAAILDVIGRQYVGPSGYIDHNYKLNVLDSAASISEAFSAIDAFARGGLIETIGITDAPEALTLTASQLVEGRAALLLINAGQYPVQIVDTAEGISAHAETLMLTAGHGFQGFVITDDEPLTGGLSFAEWAGRNGQRADGEGLEFHVRDTAYGIASAPINLLDLTGVTLTGLTVLDADTLPMGVLISLGLLETAGTADGAPLNLEGTSAEIAASLDILQDRLDTLGVIRSDNDPIVLTAAEAVEHASLLAKLQQLSGPHNASGWGLKTVQISDTAANIADNFDGLAAIRASTGILGVHVTDGQPVALTASQYAANAALLAHFGTLHDGPSHSSPTAYQVSLTGSGAEIATLLDRLQLDTHVAAITISDPANPLVVDAITVASAADALARIVGDYALHVTTTTTDLGAIVPNSADLTYLDTLRINGHVASIELTDASVPLVLTPDQQAANASLLAVVEDAYYLVVGNPGVGIAYTGTFVIPDGWLIEPKLLSSLLTIAPADVRYSPLIVDGSPVVAWSVAGFAHTAAFNGNGQVVVTIADTEGARDYATIVTTYRLNGGLLNSVVTFDNDSSAPVAIDLGSVPEDAGSVTLSAANLLPSFPGAILTAVVLETGQGNLVDNSDGTWTFTPAPNDDHNVVFAFAFGDGLLTLWSMAALDLTPANDAPVAEPVVLAAIAEDGEPRIITAAELLEGASDIDTASGDLSITSLTIQSGGGTLTDNGDGTWTYTPAADDDTSVTFAYTVSDGELTATSTATLDLTPVNDAPVAGLVTLEAVDEDGARLIRLEELLAGADDIDTAAGNLSITSLVLQSGGGTLTDNGDSWTYVPARDDDTGAVLTYTVSDGELTASASAELDIMPANDAPRAVPVVLSPLTEDGARLITAAELLVGVSDIDAFDADHFITSLTLQSGSGTLTDNGDGTWTYTPSADDDAIAVFEYTVSDGELTSVSRATLDITPVNDAPKAQPVVLAAIAEDSGPRIITAAELLEGASDIDTAADGLSIASLVLQSGSGTLADNGDGTWTYTPSADDDTDVEFEYTVSDGELTATSTATLDLTPANDAPRAEDVRVSVGEDGPPVTLTADYFDVDAGDSHVFSVDTSATRGTVTSNGDGTFQYNPLQSFDYLAVGETADDMFIYEITDAGGVSGAGTVRLTIVGTNDAIEITSEPQSGIVVEDASGATLTGGTIELRDLDLSDRHTATFVPAHSNATALGVFTLGDVSQAEGSDRRSLGWSYALSEAAAQSLAAGSVTTERFTVSLSDGSGPSVDQDVVVTILGANDTPVAGPDSGFTASPGTASTLASSSLLANDSDVDMDTLALVSVHSARHGTVAISGDNVIFTPTVGYLGAAGFSYTVSDGNGGVATASVDVQVDANVIGGTAGADRIRGTLGSDLITAGRGNDKVLGLAGNDIFIVVSGDGMDFYDGGSGSDTVDFSGMSSADGVRILLSNAKRAVGQDADHDIYRSIENVIGSEAADRISGSRAANHLDGRGGNDSLAGGGGSDVLVGGAGDDRLSGGAGIDYFVLDALGFGNDVVTDFKATGAAHDVLRVSSDLFASIDDVLAHSQQIGVNVKIVLDAESSITLLSTQISALLASPGAIELY